MSDVENAITEVARSIAARSRRTTDPVELKTLADAAASLKFGPQGYSGSIHYEYEAHTTTHDGDRRSAPVGFGATRDGSQS